MIAPASEQFTCVCCRDSFPMSDARQDIDTDGPLCPDCLLNMRLAQSILSDHGVKPCTKAHKNRLLGMY